MPARKTPLITGEYYHVFNRGINRQPIFKSNFDYQRALTTLNFYLPQHPPLKLSHFLIKSLDDQSLIKNYVSTLTTKVSILACCLMPNHFHLLLRQDTDNGISKYIGDFQNSYTKYFNANHKRTGSLLDRQFKAVHVETDEQLIHLVRYVTLNPFSSHITNAIESIQEYPFTFINYSLVTSITGLTKDNLLALIHDQASYQRSLEKIKHLTFEEK